MTKEIEYEWNEELMELIPVEKRLFLAKWLLQHFISITKGVVFYLITTPYSL